MNYRSGSTFRNNISRRNRGLCEINVTPMVDVMLLLLIVFMVTSPMLVSNIDIDLPKSVSENSTNLDEPIIITVDNSGNLYVNDNMVTNSNFISHIDLLSSGNKNINIQIHGDQRINYGSIVNAISMINAAGYEKVFLAAARNG